MGSIRIAGRNKTKRSGAGKQRSNTGVGSKYTAASVYAPDDLPEAVKAVLRVLHPGSAFTDGKKKRRVRPWDAGS